MGRGGSHRCIGEGRDHVLFHKEKEEFDDWQMIIGRGKKEKDKRRQGEQKGKEDVHISEFPCHLKKPQEDY